ncbi:unnamed protein product [Clavelina lepadiformis]|uniref:Uncharacterized protein n=1 Tax=Clavelina lepadiformis TaxID=159417 RepID=A0ABP0G4I0_CLALP
MSEEKPSTCAITYGSKQPSSLGFLQLHWQRVEESLPSPSLPKTFEKKDSDTLSKSLITSHYCFKSYIV